jgi:hypothetical protein
MRRNIKNIIENFNNLFFSLKNNKKPEDIKKHIMIAVKEEVNIKTKGKSILTYKSVKGFIIYYVSGEFIKIKIKLG